LPELKLIQPPSPNSNPPAAPPEPLLIDVAELARLTSLSVRTLRRMDASRDVPGRVVVGRRVLYQTEAIREWVRAGLPGRELWAALQKRNGKR
jgi:predicted DNA-binding transcriptional regulator AlpA